MWETNHYKTPSLYALHGGVEVHQNNQRFHSHITSFRDFSTVIGGKLKIC